MTHVLFPPTDKRGRVLVGEPGKPESGGAFPISFTLMKICKTVGAGKGDRGYIEVNGEANMRSN